MNALLISYTVVSVAVLGAVMAMLLWAAVADGRAASERRVKRQTPTTRRAAIRPQIALVAMIEAGDNV